jgi:hypothetical protein
MCKTVFARTCNATKTESLFATIQTEADSSEASRSLGGLQSQPAKESRPSPTLAKRKFFEKIVEKSLHLLWPTNDLRAILISAVLLTKGARPKSESLVQTAKFIRTKFLLQTKTFKFSILSRTVPKITNRVQPDRNWISSQNFLIHGITSTVKNNKLKQ